MSRRLCFSRQSTETDPRLRLSSFRLDCTIALGTPTAGLNATDAASQPLATPVLPTQIGSRSDNNPQSGASLQLRHPFARSQPPEHIHKKLCAVTSRGSTQPGKGRCRLNIPARAETLALCCNAAIPSGSSPLLAFSETDRTSSLPSGSFSSSPSAPSFSQGLPKPKLPKRRRYQFVDEDVAKLENEFKENPHLGKKREKELEVELGIAWNIVRNWFKNRRKRGPAAKNNAKMFTQNDPICWR